MAAVEVILPDGIDDPARPSGGNRYDRRVCEGLTGLGWDVREHPVPGRWPEPGEADLAALARVVAAVPDRAVLLVDGLIGSAAAPVLVPQAGRVGLVVLVHMPFGEVAVPPQDERAVLAAAAAVITTSTWTAGLLRERYGLPPERVHVARPGVDRADPVPGADGGNRLLCVGAVAPHKGQDLLLAALRGLTDDAWHCTLIGALDVDRGFVGRVRRQIADARLGDRVVLTRPLTGARLEQEYRRAGLLVAPSRLEAYGMAVAEALALGVPVVATAVGGLPEALGETPHGRPGLLVPPDDPAALRAALAGWLHDPGLRSRLREAALARRESLEDWAVTTARVAAVLLAARPRPGVPAVSR